MRTLRSLGMVVSVCAVLALTGCQNNGMSDLHAFVAQARTQKIKKITPIPKITPYVAFTYHQAGRRDPFVPEQSEKTAKRQAENHNGIHPDLGRPRQVLEQFPLDALQMKGVLRFDGTQYALVAAPDGVVHRVTTGDYMGKHFGRIVKITPGAVQLVETVRNGFGGWKHRAAKLTMTSTTDNGAGSKAR